MSTTIARSKAPRVANKEGRQYRKSQATKKRILDTAIKCFVDYGYHQTAVLKIAEISGLSRGAMRHHFVAKIDIVEAAIEYLYEKRLNAFREAVKHLPADGDRIEFAVRSFWAQVNHPLYMAFFELSVASRTDQELAAILRPAEERFNEQYMAMAAELFPEWSERPETLRLALNLSRFLLEGIAVDLVARESMDMQDVLALLGQMLRELRDRPRD